MSKKRITFDAYANTEKFGTLDRVNKNHDPDRQMVFKILRLSM
jgi:hypothetical protein